MTTSKETLLKAFREAGYRLTGQREKIFESLAEASARGVHPSARQVFEGLRQRHDDISVATVYNTLGTLAKLGLVKIIEFESGDNRYETNLDAHVNLICTSCGDIQDLFAGAAIHTECAREQLGFEVRDFRLEYYGLCARCCGGRPGVA